MSVDVRDSVSTIKVHDLGSNLRLWSMDFIDDRTNTKMHDSIPKSHNNRLLIYNIVASRIARNAVLLNLNYFGLNNLKISNKFDFLEISLRMQSY